jgi:Domain of unknown function (DUF4347)/FG-GAP-like repeat
VSTIVFIDSRVPDIQDLLNGLQPDEQAFVIDSSSDGLQQIADILQANDLTGLTSISIVSHGSSGSIDLGSSVIDDSNLSSHADALAALGGALAPSGTIQLYGCDVALGTTGQQFINDFSALAGGAPVEAATQQIGQTSTGENWTLDASTAQTVAPAVAPFTATAQANFAGNLAGTLDGQLWYINQGGSADAITGHLNSDGNNITPVGNQNTGTAHESDAVAVDLAAGFYFTVSSDQLHIEARSINDPATIIDSVEIGDPASGPATQDLLNAIAIDPTTHTLYVGRWGQTTALTGIVEVNYSTANGTLDHNAAYNASPTFLITNTGTGGKVTDIRDFSIDLTNHKLYFTDDDNNFSGGGFVATDNISVVNYTGSPTVTQLTTNAQFPANQSGGIIGPSAADTGKGLIYFETNTAGHSAATLWYMPIAGGTATAVTLPGGSALGFGDIPQGGISIDEQSQYIFVTVQSGSLFAGPDEILQGQLSADGHSITSWVNTYPIATLDGHTPDVNSHVADTWFDQLPTLSSLSGTTTHAVEQSTNVTLLTAAPTITDTDGNHLASAYVQITGGTFSTATSDENSTDDDHLTIASAHRTGTDTSGTINGTSLSYSYDSSTEKLTLTGYDTEADYQTALSFVQYFTTGDNPTDYDRNTTRTVTWYVSDGAPNVPAGAQNSGTTTLTIDGKNDAPVAHAPASYSGTEGTALNLHNANLNVSDVDGGITGQNETATLSVSHGILHAAAGTGVSSGVTITNNNSSSLTVNGTIAQINGLLNGDLTSTLTLSGLLDADDTPNSATLSLSINDNGFNGVPPPGAQTSNIAQSTITASNDTSVSFTGLSSNTTGSPVQGSQITATVNDDGQAVSGVTFTWKVAGIGVVGDSSNTYTPTEADEGKALTVDVSFNDPADPTVTESDTGISVGSPNTVLDSADLVANLSSNLPTQDSPISVTGVTDGGNNVLGSVTFQWKVNTGLGFNNATGNGNASATYTPTEGDEGAQLEVVVTYTGDDGNPSNTETTTVVATNTVADSNDLTATISTDSPVQGTAISVATASDGGTNVLGTATYQWMVNTGVSFVNATGTGNATATYTPTEGDEGGQLEVVVTLTDKGNAGNTETTTVVATNTVADSADLVGVLSNNSPVQGSPISLNTVTDGGNNVIGTATYQWLVNTTGSFVDAGGAGATSATYTPIEADEGGQLEVVITFADPGNGGNPETTTVVATNTIADSSDLTATISNNSPVQGTPLSVATANDGGTDVLGSATYQWMVNTGAGFNNATGGGATSATYTPAEADENGTLEVVVSVSDGGNAGSTESTTVVAGNKVAEIADLTATLSTDSPVQDTAISVATASDGGTNVLGSATYQWMVNTGVSFVNATGTGNATATYTPTEGDEGGQLEVVVSLTDPGAPGGTETTTVVANNAVADSADLVGILSNNSPVQGSPISLNTVTDGGNDVIGTATYQWKVNTTGSFVDATGNGNATATYTPTEADEGGQLEVVITLSGDPGNGGNPETKTVVASNTVADTSDLTATISNNSPVQGTALSVVTADDGGTNVLSTASYQWMVNTGLGFNNATGLGATSATYTPAEADENGTLEVVVSVNDGGNPGSTESTTVVANNKVAEISDLTATLSTDSPVQDTAISVATASDGGADVLGSATYQWMVNTGVSFANATGSGNATATYTPTEGDEGGQLEVVVSLTDPGAPGGTETTTVLATNTVADSTDLVGTLSNNSPVQGSPISLTTVTDNGTDVKATATYQWMVNTGLNFVNAIGAGAATATYTPTEGDEGGQLEVVITYADQGGTETSTVVATNTVADSSDLTATLSNNSPVQGTPVSVATASDGGNNVLGTASYQWMVNTGGSFQNATGLGATTATYTPAEADEGNQLEVVVTLTDQGNPLNTESTTVVASNTVAETADLTATLSTNSPVQASPISVATASESGTDVLGTATYQWMVNTGGGFVNATGTGNATATYTPTEGDEGGHLEVVVSLANDPGNPGNTEITTVVAANAIADSADLVGTLSTNSPAQALPISLTTVTDNGTDVKAVATYQWKVNTGAGFANATGSGNATATYTPTEGDEGGQLEVVITYADQGGTETATVLATNTVADSSDFTATLSSNSPVQGTQISVATASDGGTNVLATATYQWKVNTGSGFVNATGAGNNTATYTPTEGDEGGQLEIVATLTDKGNLGSTETTTVVAGNAVADSVDLTATLSSNSPVQGSQISVATASDGGTNVLGAASYQWKINNGSGFVNATGTGNNTATYMPTEGDEGGQLEVVVTLTDKGNSGNTETTTVVATNAVADSADLSALLSTNNPVQGTPISLTTVADNGADVKATATYQWMVNTGSGFANATGIGAATATYTPTEGDEGGRLEVVITYADQGGTETATFTPLNAVADSVDLTATLSSNSPVQSTAISVATASDGGTDVLGTATYQWKVNNGSGFVNAAGPGNNTATYTPIEGDEGGQLEVVVSVTDPGNPGPTESTTVVAGNVVADSADLVATLSPNSPVQGVAKSVATVTDAGVDVRASATYQWKVNTGSGFINATGTGATTATYTPVERDEGGFLQVVISYTDPGNPGNTEQVTLTTQNRVADSADLVATLSSTTAVEGTPISVASVTDGPNNVLSSATYQWQVNTGSGFVNATGTGATTATYTPTEGDEGGTLQVVVSFADAGNASGSETTTVSAGTVQESSTENATISLAGLASGNAVEGQQITATVTEPDAPASGINYTWKVNGTTVFTGTDAAGNTYTPTEADEGLPITVSASFTDTHGNAESGTTSAGTVQESPTENASFTVTGLISGHPVPNHTLTATVTEPDAPASGITYTWIVNGVTRQSGSSNTYTPQPGDAAKQLTVTVSFTDTHGFAETGTTQNFGNVGSNAHYDFNGDSVSDLAFQQEAFNAGGAKGTPTIWLWNGSAVTSQATLSNPGASWHVVASGDVNGDGNADLIWHNDNGQPSIWLMNGTTINAAVTLSNPGANWHLLGSGDFNGDGMADLLWQATDGTVSVWLMNGTTPTATANLGGAGPTWVAVGAADFNGDGHDDILLQDTTTGNLMVDTMNGTTVTSSVSINVGDKTWHAVSTGTFNGVAEIAWQNDNGTPSIWQMNGTTPTAEVPLLNPGSAWSLISIDHFTPDGQGDLLFQNINGAMGVWDMNGTTIAAMLAPPNPGIGSSSVNGNPFVDPPGRSSTSNASTATGTTRESTPDSTTVVSGLASLSPNLLATTSDPTLTQHQLVTGG